MTALIAKPNYRLLIVDDNRAIHEDFRKILCADDGTSFDGMEAALFKAPAASRQLPYDIDSSYQGQDAVARVEKAREEERPYALAFIDVRMPPGWDGVETAARIWKISPDTQIVLCTAYSDYSWDEVLSKLNRSDHLVILKKPFDVVEVLQLAAGLTEQYRLAQEVRARMGQLETEVEKRTLALQQASEALRESEERYKLLFRENPFPMWVFDLKTLAIVKVNEAAVQSYGYSEEAFLALKLKDLHCPEDWPALLEKISDENARPTLNSLVSRHRKQDGSVISVEVSSRVIRLDGRDATLSLAQDITDRQKMEAQRLRTHRVESVCTLATGMAHELT